MRAIRIKMNPGNLDQPGYLTQMVEICQDDITVSETMQWIREMIGNQEPVFHRSTYLKEVGMPESWAIISAEKASKKNEVATYLAGGKAIYGDALFITLRGEIGSESEYWFEPIAFSQSAELIPEFVNYCVLADQGKLRS